MKPFYLQLIFFTLFLNILVLGQVPEFTFRNINSDHGLPENIVLDIKEDKMGFLWIATPNYLSRYDGINFKVFPKTFDYRTDYGDFKIGKLLVFEDQLWMITKDGKLEILDLLTEGFQSLDYFIDGSEIPELRSLHIVNKDEIYLGTERNGVYLADHVFNIIKHYDQGAIFSPNRLISNKVNAIHKDALNRLWVLTDQGVNRMHNSNNDVLLDKVNASLLFEENKNHGVICIGSHGDTYFGSFFMGDNFFPSSRYESDGYKIPQDLWINGLYFDSKDRMWSGSMSQGVFIINHGGSYFMKQVMPIENNLNSLADKSILCMYGNGNEGGLWIGTDGGGISFFDEGPEYFKKLKFKETSKNDLLRHV